MCAPGALVSIHSSGWKASVLWEDQLSCSVWFDTSCCDLLHGCLVKMRGIVLGHCTLIVLTLDSVHCLFSVVELLVARNLGWCVKDSETRFVCVCVTWRGASESPVPRAPSWGREFPRFLGFQADVWGWDVQIAQLHVQLSLTSVQQKLMLNFPAEAGLWTFFFFPCVVTVKEYLILSVDISQVSQHLGKLAGLWIIY